MTKFLPNITCDRKRVAEHSRVQRRQNIWARSLLFFLFFFVSRAAQSAPLDPAFQTITDNPKLPRVLLIGDSISIGYTIPVRTALKERANVHRPATNCQGTKQGLVALDKWLGHEPWDVIHFNFGIHDLKYVGPRGELRPPLYGQQVTSPTQYESNLRAIVARLKQTKAILIWCSTTPIASGTLGFMPGDEVKFNAIAAKVMQENGVFIDDLHAAAAPRLSSIQLPANVHFTTGGYEVLGAAVAGSIRAALPPPPSIASLSKSSGPLNSSLLINGTNFTNTQSVQFDGIEAPNFKELSARQLEVTVPPFATDGKIGVTTHGGTALSDSSFHITPEITGFTPSSGRAGTLVEIEGTTLSGTRALTFNSVSAPLTFGSNTRLQAKIPLTATTGPIHLLTPNGTATSRGEFQVTPQLNRFTPARGTAGTSVTLSGTGLSDIRQIDFNGRKSTFHPVSPTEVQAVVPAEATSGRIRVTTRSGTAVSNTNFLIVPEFTGFAPDKGTVGSSVTIKGTTLSAVTAVTLNGIKARFTRISATQLQIVVPPNATSGRIALTTPAGNVVSLANFAVLPQILNFTPARGRTGTAITVLGTGFNAVRLVSIDGQICRFTVLSPTRINVIAPPKAGTGPIQVVTTEGLCASRAAFTTLPLPPRRNEGTADTNTATLQPTISTVTPDLATSSLRLTFLQEPQEDSVTDPALYDVTIDGAPVTVQSVTYTAGAVILGLPSGSLNENSQVTVQWR